MAGGLFSIDKVISTMFAHCRTHLGPELLLRGRVVRSWHGRLGYVMCHYIDSKLTVVLRRRKP